jgi:raffinose/stachyose/melibiose transport system substrate-binding protein
MFFKRAIFGSAILLVFGVVSTPAAGSREAPPRSPPKVTLTFRHTWVQEHDMAIQRLFADTVRRIMEENPWINIECAGMDQEVHRQQKLKAEMVTGNPPDIFILWGGSEIDPYVRAGRMMDLTDFLEASGLRNRFVDLSMWERDGRVYGLPLEGFCECVYYNKELFRKAGVSVPRTTDELLQVCAELRAAGITPFALGNRDKWPAVMLFQYFLNRSAGTDRLRLVQEGAGAWTDPAYRRGAELFSSLVAIRAFTEGANSLPYEMQGTMFIEEKAAMVVTGSWDSDRFGASPIADRIGCFPFPAMSGGVGPQDDICAAFSFGLGFSSAATDAKKAAVETFIAAVFNDELQSRYMYEAARVPSMKIPFDPERIANPVFAATLKLFKSVPSTWPAYDGRLHPAVNQAVNDAVQKLVAGTDARKALEAVQRVQRQNLIPAETVRR